MEEASQTRLHPWYVHLAEFTSQRGFVHQMLLQLSAAFFSGVVAYRVYVGLKVLRSASLLMHAPS